MVSPSPRRSGSAVRPIAARKNSSFRPTGGCRRALSASSFCWRRETLSGPRKSSPSAGGTASNAAAGARTKTSGVPYSSSTPLVNWPDAMPWRMRSLSAAAWWPKAGIIPLSRPRFLCQFVFGPHMEDFAEIAARTNPLRGACRVESGDTLEAVLRRILTDTVLRRSMEAAAWTYVDANRGVVHRHLEAVETLLAGKPMAE